MNISEIKQKIVEEERIVSMKEEQRKDEESRANYYNERHERQCLEISNLKKDLDNWRLKSLDTEKQCEDLRDIERKYMTSEDEARRLKVSIEELRSRLLESEKKALVINDMTMMLNNANSEIERSSNVINGLQKEIESWRQKNVDMEGEINKWKDLESRAIDDNMKLVAALEDLKAQSKDIESNRRQIIDDFTKESERYRDDIKSLGNTIDALNNEIINLKSEANQYIREIDQLKQLEKRLAMTLEDKKKLEDEIVDLRNKLIQLERETMKINELEGDLKYKRNECERTHDKYEEAKREIELLKGKIFDLEKLLSEVREIENKIVILEDENNRLKAQLDEKRTR